MPTFLWPVKKVFTRIVQGYGEPWSANNQKLHTGADIHVPPGEKVFAAAAGTITKTGILGNDWANYAVLEHENKDYCTSYLHIDFSVKVGDKLKAGDLIGCTAKISAPHLHFNIWKGPVDAVLTQRGALPKEENAGKIEPKTDPAFPANFLNPADFQYQYIEVPNQTSNDTLNSFLIIKELVKGSSGPDVLLLQKILNTDPDTQIATTGSGSPGQESDFFGDLTLKAVENLQIKYSIAKAGDVGFGIVGPKTREKLLLIFKEKFS